MHYSMNSLAVLVLAALPAAATLAQEPISAYPSKPVRVIASQAAGGGADSIARLFSSKLSEYFGRQFVVENHPGRDLAWTMTARSKPDGYTLMPILPDFTFAPALYPDLPVDPAKDFAPISLMARTPYMLVVNSAFPAKNIQEFVAYARANPGKVNFSGGLPGTGTNLVAIWFLSQANAKATYVPYKGVSQAVVDLLAGRVDATFATGSATPHLKSGKLRSLGVSTATRSKLSPDIPTIQEQGVTFDASSFHGWGAPAGTPSGIIDKLAAELIKATKSPDVIKTMAADNSEPVGTTPAEFRKFIAAEIPRWVKVVKDSGIKATAE